MNDVGLSALDAVITIDQFSDFVTIIFLGLPQPIEYPFAPAKLTDQEEPTCLGRNVV